MDTFTLKPILYFGDSALSALEAAGSAQELEALRVQYLGKKGELTAVLKMMGKLSPEERPQMGQLAFSHLILWQQAPMLRLLLRTMGCIRHQLKELQEMDSRSSGRLLP